MFSGKSIYEREHYLTVNEGDWKLSVAGQPCSKAK